MFDLGRELMNDISFDLNCVFLGGVFSAGQQDIIKFNSMGVVQNAADSLQKKLLVGLDGVLPNGVRIVNLPFVGSYPSRFKKLYFPGCAENFGNNSSLFGVGFVNISGFKLLFRFFSSLVGLYKTAKMKNTVLFVYSAHLPFLFSALLIRCLRCGIRICIVLPDLPEYMGDGAGFFALIKRIDTWIFYKIVTRLDYFVVLTSFMADKIRVDKRRVVVVEGIASLEEFQKDNNQVFKSSEVRSVLYTGTLARRYGILDLVDAFGAVECENSELWICGEGDGKDYVAHAAKLDSRIKYFGQVGREEAINLQQRATFLINPRPPEGEFTKYSFPSKIMEYMATGRPVIMYKLDGIPSDYDGLFISPTTVGADGIAHCLRSVLIMSDDELNNIGRAARAYVLTEKSPIKQSMKILNLIMESE